MHSRVRCGKRSNQLTYRKIIVREVDASYIAENAGRHRATRRLRALKYAILR